MGSSLSPRTDSAPDGGAEVAQREFGGGFPAALGAMFDVAPTAEQSGALGIEQDHKGLREGIDLDSVAWLPLGRGWAGTVIGTLHHTAKPRSSPCR